MRKLLIFSHAAVLEVNRGIFQAVAENFDGSVRLVAPKTWKGDLIKELRLTPGVTDRKLDIIDPTVCFSGNGSLFFYASRLGKALEDTQEQSIFLDEEPWSLNALQVYLLFPRSKKFFFTKQNIFKRYPPPFRQIEKFVYGRTTHAFGCSREVLSVLEEKGYRGNSSILPHSYDPSIFRKNPDEQNSEKKGTLGIAPDRLVFSYFGRLVSEKGIADLIEAIGLIKKDSGLSKKVFFLWVGNGPMKNQVQESCDKMGKERALWIPAIPHHQVGETLNISDVLILPSRTVRFWKEQFGRILVEAMACGSAVIGSNSGEIPWLIQQTGGGLVFPERNVPSLLSTIQSLVDQPSLLHELKSKGHSYVSYHLTHSAVARSLFHTLDKY